MANQQLIDYIHKQLKAGFSREAITNALVNKGWRLQDIDQVFLNTEAIKSRQVPSEQIKEVTLSTTNKFRKGLLFVVLSLLVVVLIIISIWLYAGYYKNSGRIVRILKNK